MRCALGRPTIVGPDKNHGRFLIWAFVMFCILAIGGCKKREFAQPTPQMDIDQKHWVRVLLSKDAENLTLKTDPAFHIISPDTIKNITK